MHPQLSLKPTFFASIQPLPLTMSIVDKVISLVQKSERVPEPIVLTLCQKVQEILVSEANVQLVPTPVTICGDIHGQLHDLLTLFKTGGECPSTNYLFLGDFVDRGFYSVESLLLLLAYKVRYPDRMTLIRGNHESRQITASYGFYDECIRKYGSSVVWHTCCNVFDYLSLAALVGGPGGVLCVHGGLSPTISKIDEIRLLDRKQEVPHDGAMCDLLWSDPDDTITETDGQGQWGVSPRGAGYLFGDGPVTEFNRVNNTSLIARAHQLVLEGYRELFNGQLVTVWSAPNYCYRCGNVAAILNVDDDYNREYKVFEAVEPANNDRLVPMKQPIAEYFL